MATRPPHPDPEELRRLVQEFLAVSAGNRSEHARQMLADAPDLPDDDAAAALAVGDVARVRAALERDPGLATRSSHGWTSLHVVCSSRWHMHDPWRAEALAACARVLLDAGADLNARAGRGGRTPLACAAATASTSVANEPLIRLLLERGARPGDHDLYLMAFASDSLPSLRLLLDHMPDLSEARSALSAPMSTGNVEVLRALLEGGVDPRRYRNEDDDSDSAAYDAVSWENADVLALLLERGADPDAPGPDGRSPYRRAVADGGLDLAELLTRHGAREDATPGDRFLSACLHADRAAAERALAADPGLLAAGPGALVVAAGRGDTAAVELMLDLGFAPGARGHDGATALHAAAYAGAAGTVRLLLARSAELEARDTRWDSTPLGWALVGSGLRPGAAPSPDWVAAVTELLDAGAEPVAFSQDDPKAPSEEVARLVRARTGARSSAPRSAG